MSTNLVGEKIKALSETKKISLQEIAERSGLTAEQLDIILNSDKIPSLSPVIKIARALGVRLGTFMDELSAGKVPEMQYGIAFAVKGTGANLTVTLAAN